MAEKHYKVLTELRYPADAESLKKALSGSWEGTLNWKTVYPGEIVSDIPSEVAKTLLETKDIEAAKGPVPAKVEPDAKEG
jgi:hypothetical protein